MKTVYGWVVDWGKIMGRTSCKSIDLLFSSKEKFNELLGSNAEELIPIRVPDDFDDLDYIPDDY